MLTRNHLIEFKKRIHEHFYNEAQIMNDLLESDLSKDEIKELKEFMLKHPFYEISNFVQKKNGET